MPSMRLVERVSSAAWAIVSSVWLAEAGLSDEELRGKTKLAEDAQDEMVAMGVQLNIAEEKSEKLTKENRELVERWMKRMGEEADRVNRDSNWD